MTPPTFKCQYCGGDTYCEPPAAPAICAECCGKRGEHEFEYVRAERQRLCIHCNELAPDDYYHSDDDVPLMSASEFRSDRPLGTPLSQLSGRPGEPGFAEFCRIAKSWGYE